MLRIRAWLPFVASAALVAVALKVSWDHPWVGIGVLMVLAFVSTRRLRARRRLAALAHAGRTDELLQAWQDAMADMPHAQTLLPLIHATAFTSSGQTDRARAALERAAQGDAWQSAVEHRLIVETLLDAFEGERELALTKSAKLVELPVPPVGPLMHGRILQLRSAIAAAARAFAHRSTEQDVRLLSRAAHNNPLVHWPLRYAAAIALIDHGRGSDANALLSGAPDWPEDSAFAAFHPELVSHATAQR